MLSLDQTSKKKKRPDHNSGRDGPSEALCAYELLRVASEDAAAANETEQTGCQKDRGTGSGTELGGVTAIDPWKFADAALIEIDRLLVVQRVTADVREGNRNSN